MRLSAWHTCQPSTWELPVEQLDAGDRRASTRSASRPSALERWQTPRRGSPARLTPAVTTSAVPIAAPLSSPPGPTSPARLTPATANRPGTSSQPLSKACDNAPRNCKEPGHQPNPSQQLRPRSRRNAADAVRRLTLVMRPPRNARPPAAWVVRSGVTWPALAAELAHQSPPTAQRSRPFRPLPPPPELAASRPA
jgi:hypothetical protein